MNRLLLLLLVIGSSSALKGTRTKLRRLQDGTVITQENAKVAKDPNAPPKDPPVAADALKEKKDPKVTADAVKEKKEKKVKTCKKRPPAVPNAVGDGSATTSQLSLPSIFGGGEDEEEATPPADNGTPNGNPPPPPPPADNSLTTPLPPGASEGVEGDSTTVAPDDLPYCTAVGKKVRSDAYCEALLAGNFPDHKSVKGMIEFDVMYDEAQPAVLESVKDKIKKKTSRKTAGCKEVRRERRRLQAPTDNVVPTPPPPPEEIYISGVKFGDFDVQDKCDAFEDMEGCDKISTDVEILYEAPDNRDVTEEEAETLFVELLQMIQQEGFDGALVDNLNAEINGSNRSVGGGKAGAIAGGTLAAAAVVAGVAVYKRYGGDIAAKWG